MSIIHHRSARHTVEKIILGNTKRCPDCKNKLKLAPKYYWCSHCRTKVYPKSLCWLRNSKLSYKKILILLQTWQKGLSPGSVKELTGLSYPTIARWYGLFRIHLPSSDNVVLAGEIEADESFFGRQKFHNQEIVIGVTERGSGRRRLKIIPDRDQDTLEAFLLATVSKDSLVSTDAHKSYEGIEWYGYIHWQSNHSIGQFRETNQIEGTWSVIKRHIRRMYGSIRMNLLPQLLIEFEARANFKYLFKDCQSYLQECLFRVL